jgi:hypothetical protein
MGEDGTELLKNGAVGCWAMLDSALLMACWLTSDSDNLRGEAALSAVVVFGKLVKVPPQAGQRVCREEHAVLLGRDFLILSPLVTNTARFLIDN